MDKIKLRLCAGTMCYVMGGAQLMEIEELLSEEEKQGIEITFSPCLQRQRYTSFCRAERRNHNRCQ